MRFKPPPRNSNIGWRVEFRSMDIQLTDHENAAFSIFVVLLTRTILHLKLNLYMPLSQVDENMHRSQQRDAVNSQKFWFRSIVKPNESPELFSLMTLDEIMNGNATTPGLVTLVDQYIDTEQMHSVTRLKLKRYTSVIARKANGTLSTGATWMRGFVSGHAAYKQDSVVGPVIAHDLLEAVLRLDSSNLQMD